MTYQSFNKYLGWKTVAMNHTGLYSDFSVRFSTVRLSGLRDSLAQISESRISIFKIGVIRFQVFFLIFLNIFYFYCHEINQMKRDWKKKRRKLLIFENEYKPHDKLLFLKNNLYIMWAFHNGDYELYNYLLQDHVLVHLVRLIRLQYVTWQRYCSTIRLSSYSS
jgi:hypothetical protein